MGDGEGETEMKVLVNANEQVKVKLTDKGKDIFYHQYDETNKSYGREVIKPYFHEVDKDGYTKFVLWELMRIYGQHLSNGCDIPFETEIMFETNL
jgi:hypothetical protein